MFLAAIVDGRKVLNLKDDSEGYRTELQRLRWIEEMEISDEAAAVAD